MVNYRLDFTTSIKIFFSIESFFRIFHCGFSQPLKIFVFLFGWQPTWLIRFTKFVGDKTTRYTPIGPGIDQRHEHWMTKELVCSIPVHLDMTALFGIAIFIVMSNSARYLNYKITNKLRKLK
jgi:hypothetical protein